MGMLTSGRIDIAAPAADVFSWLVDPAKLTAWVGGSGGMPEDRSVLEVGWTSTSDVPPVGRTTTEILHWDPPWGLDTLTSYPGGDAHTSYRLTEGDGTTTLMLESDTDWARPEGVWDAAIESAVAGQSEAVRDVVEQHLEQAEARLDAGLFDGLAQSRMQEALEAQLQKLKALAEIGG